MAIGINCCENCIPPKRHLGCHSTCKEYADEKAQLEKDKIKFKANRAQSITAYDFNKIIYVSGKSRKNKI